MKIKSRSFFISLLFQYIFIMFIITSVFFFIFFNIIKNNYLNNLKDELKNNLMLIEDLTGKYLTNIDYNDLNYKIKELDKKLNKRITIIKSDGLVIADSEENYKKMENHSNRIEIQSAVKGETGEAIRFSNTLKAHMLYVAVPLTVDNTLYVYRISVLLKNINQIIMSFKIEIFILGAVFLFFVVIFSYFVSKKFSYPIEILCNASNKVAGGDFSTTVFFERANYEIKILAENFNEMTLKLKNYFTELRDEKEELGSIITSMKESVLVVDNSGKIIRANKSFIEMVKNDKVHDKYYWEIFRDSSLTSFIKNYDQIQKNIVKELNYNEKILLCSMNYLLNKNGFVFIFYDVTELKKLEIIKKDFTVSVSHELRTPLTAIKGFAETLLEEESSDNNKKYLEIILRNTERLINIVNDLLVISELEEDSTSKLQVDDININTAINNIMNIFEKRVKEKQIKIIYHNQSKLKNIHTDINKLEQILINLIDNAVKYTDAGDININFYEENENYKIDVLDSGIGIPESEIDRIFERFFVVDKSRSKKNGGTGLGLAIVKHDVILLNGDIKVSSSLGKGSCFSIILPKKYDS